MQSKYIVFPAPSKVEVWEETINAPEPGEVLCEATTSLLSIGTEMYCLRGEFEPGTNWADWVHYPFRAGYCMVARVAQVGPGVTGLREGDRIISRTPHQQFYKIEPRGALVLPAGVDDIDAAWGRLAATAQMGVRRARLELGESVAVIGLGILGQLAVQYCKLAGARRVIAIDVAPDRLELAQAHGATHVLHMDAQSAREEVARLTQDRMLDVVFDITGHPAVLPAAVSLLHRFGRLVLLGDTPNPSAQHLGPGVLSNSISILAIHGGAHPVEATDFAPWSRGEMTLLFFDYVAQGRMRVADLVTHRLSPFEAPQIYQHLKIDRSDALGILFDWSKLREKG